MDGDISSIGSTQLNRHPLYRSYLLRHSSLIRRCQFLLGPQAPINVQGWVRYSLPGSLCLTTHPDLGVTTVTDAERALTLLGFMLDPADPSANDTAILKRLLRSCRSLDELLAAAGGLGGRWVLIAHWHGAAQLFTDALGLRQVLYMVDARGVWAMSQAGLALELLGATLDEDAELFMHSHPIRASAEYRWPGAATAVRGLRHLLPNHVLDLRGGKVRRYWPDTELPRLSMIDASDHVSSLLTGLLSAAAKRFDLALGITAGLDSRLVLAAARSIKEQLTYVTVRQAKMPDDHADVVIPARLLSRLGLTHQIVRAAGSMSPDFSWAYKQSVHFAHDHYGPDAEAIFDHFGLRKVAVTGSGAEIARCSFRKEAPFVRWRRISAADLARLQQIDHPFALRHFEEWLKGARDCENVHLLDLFEWEQAHGNWLAMTQLEFDIAWRDIFTPFNCRSLLATLLSVPESLRRAPDYALFKLQIKKLWPQTLIEPINPTPPLSLLHRGARFARRTLYLYNAYARV